MYYFREVNVKKQSQENPKIPNQSDTRSSWWRYHLKHFSDFYVTRRWLQGVKNRITSRVQIFTFPETSESLVGWRSCELRSFNPILMVLVQTGRGIFENIWLWSPWSTDRVGTVLFKNFQSWTSSCWSVDLKSRVKSLETDSY